MAEKRDAIDRLVLTSDKRLSTEELRSRWIFQHPLGGGLAPLIFLCVIVSGIGLIFDNQISRPFAACLLGITTIFALISRVMLRRKANSMSREQLLTEIARLRAIHQEDCPF